MLERHVVKQRWIWTRANRAAYLHPVIIGSVEQTEAAERSKVSLYLADFQSIDFVRQYESDFQNASWDPGEALGLRFARGLRRRLRPGFRNPACLRLGYDSRINAGCFRRRLLRAFLAARADNAACLTRAHRRRPDPPP